MSANFPKEMKTQLAEAGVIAVLVLDKAEDAAPLADALLAGGVTAVELALRTPDSLAALKAMRKHAPDILLGAGTVLTPDQLGQARDAGADFAVAPGTNRRVLEASHGASFPFGPGVAVPSDIETALEYGCKTLKFFPAEPSGGLAFLKSMAGPYAHLGIQYIPLGGLKGDNITPYVQSPLILALGGSWIAPRETIISGEWSTITERARYARNIIEQTPKSA